MKKHALLAVLAVFLSFVGVGLVTSTAHADPAVTLSGQVFDSTGLPLHNQLLQVFVPGEGPVYTATTDNQGFYSVTTAPGDYAIVISARGANANTDLSQNIPEYYSVDVTNYHLDQTKTQNFQYPTKKISVVVKDDQGNPVPNVDISVGNSGFGALSLGYGVTSVDGGMMYVTGEGPKTDALGRADIWVFPGTYNLFATPSSGSYKTAVLRDVTFTSDTEQDMTLQRSVTVSGHVYDAAGNPLRNQLIDLTVPGNNAADQIATDSNGYYTLSVSPARYNLDIQARGPYANLDFSQHIPQYYGVNVPDVDVSADITRDIYLPAKKVTITVKNALGLPVSGTAIKTNNGFGPLDLGNGLTNVSGQNMYVDPAPTTDANGKVDLWLFPSDYSFTVTPSNSLYTETTTSNVHITADTNVAVTLPSAITAPVVQVLNPVSNSTVSGTVSINGTIQASGPYSYMLYVFDSTSKAVVSKYVYSTPASTTGMTYSWDSTTVPNGNYSIVLSAKDLAGNKDANSTKTVKIKVAN
jgi:hypothetical protein